MRHIHSLLLLAGALLFAACGADKTDKTTATENADTTENIEAQAPENTVAVEGGLAYDPTLTDADGNEVKLSSLYGKLTYIDIWATWCPPCCREIPFLEQVVEQFKDEEGIQFISISCDQDANAWQTKLATDQPDWMQFILSPEEASTFLGTLGINSIPRFMLLAPDGRVLEFDCIRPSDANLPALLKANL